MKRRHVISALLVVLTLTPSALLAGGPDRYVFTFDDTHGALRLSAACGFPIVVREWGTLIDLIYYDSDGDFVGENLILHSGGVSATNASTGFTVSSPSVGLFRYGLEDASSSGLGLHFVLPGGEQIALEMGRLVIDYATGTASFEVGVHDIRDGNLDSFCAALAGS